MELESNLAPSAPLGEALKDEAGGQPYIEMPGSIGPPCEQAAPSCSPLIEALLQAQPAFPTLVQ